ncbi:putative reverse transcriptase domain-containing protein [Tanacetum coccineum]
MPPRRNKNINDVYEQEFEQRVMARMEERLDQFVDQLADRMNDMMNTRRHEDRNGSRSEGEESENPFFKGDGSSSDEQPNRPRRNQREDNRHWESRMRVPENKRVSLIATKLRGRESSWWQQLKLTNERIGKPRVTSWRKMKKCMRANFNPQTNDQLVSHYIGGLRVQIMDSVNMFDLVTFSDAYQRALAFEKHNRRIGSSSSPAITGCGSGSSNVASHFVPNQARPGGDSDLKCFNCGVPGHRQTECKKAGKRTLFDEPKEWEDDGVADDDYEEASAVGDDWLKHNIFQSTCNILGKVCTFVVYLGSFDNLIVEETVQKLGLKTENHLKPYKLQWLKKGGEVTISKGVLVTFSIGTTYKDSVWCYMVPIDAFHLLLGRPWEYDRNTTYNRRANTYSFLFGGELEMGNHVKAWDQKLCQAKFAHNHAVNRSIGFSPFQPVYSAHPCGPLNLMSLHVFDYVPKKVQDFVEGLHEVHKAVRDNLCMTRSLNKDLIQPFNEPGRVFLANLKLFKTSSLDYSNSLEFNLFSEYKEHSEGEVTKTMTEPTMEKYMTKTQEGGSDNEDATEHIKKVLEIVVLFHIPNITQDQVMLRAFSISLTGAASHWLRNEPSGSITNWETLKEIFLNMQEVILFYKRLDVPTRQILNFKGAIPSTKAADAKKGPYYTKDCPLKEEGKKLEEAYYTQFGVSFPQGGKYRALALGFYQRNNRNPSYQERRKTMEESLSKFMAESAKRHEENSNLIKEIRAATDSAIINQGASIKAL